MLQGSNPEEIETVLPNGREVTFAVYRCSREGEGAGRRKEARLACAQIIPRIN